MSTAHDSTRPNYSYSPTSRRTSHDRAYSKVFRRSVKVTRGSLHMNAPLGLVIDIYGSVGRIVSRCLPLHERPAVLGPPATVYVDTVYLARLQGIVPKSLQQRDVTATICFRMLIRSLETWQGVDFSDEH